MGCGKGGLGKDFWERKGVDEEVGKVGGNTAGEEKEKRNFYAENKVIWKVRRTNRGGTTLILFLIYIMHSNELER